PERLMSIKSFLFRYVLLTLLLMPLSGDDKKSSVEIQRDIDSRNVELQSLRNEIKNIEEKLIRKNKEAISNTEILINLGNKISLTEKLIRSLHREEQHISNIIHNTQTQIVEKENQWKKLKRQLTQRLQYLYIHGRPGLLKTVLSSEDWNSAIYRIKYLNILAKHEKKLRKNMKETLVLLEKEKAKRLIDLNRKSVLLSEKKNENIRLEKDKKEHKEVLSFIKEAKHKLELNRTQKNQMIMEMEQLI
ncbi:uncharacterized protein METZ01_LOCUS471226, partial [marine metagenome]